MRKQIFRATHAIFGKPGLAALLFAHVLVLSAVELGLLHAKYEIFKPAFLQSHVIAGFDIPLFVGLLIAMELSFYGFLLAAGAALAARWGVSRTTLAYHYFWGAGVLSLAFIGGRYQLAQYFSDFLTFSVVKNLGGGSLADALRYILEEGAVALAAGAFLVLVYLLGNAFVRGGVPTVGVSEPLAGRATYYVRWAILASVGTAICVWVANQSSDFRYHMNRTTAYFLAKLALDAGTDFDGDGYGYFAWRPDPWPFDASRYPDALDVPDDGIDQDGLFGDFHEPVDPGRAALAPSHRDNIVLVVVESLRADALDARVNGRPVMPNLKEIASEGIAAPLYYSHTGYTTSSLKAIFCGTLTDPTSPENCLFGVLRRAGYQIAVVSGQAEGFGELANKVGSRKFADIYFDAETAKEDRVFPSAALGSLALSNHRVVQQFRQALGALDLHRPFFFYLNLQSAHFPYYYHGMPNFLGIKPLPRGKIDPSRRERLRETYYNAVAYADWALGQIVEEIRHRGLSQRTWFVISGDHGESLFDDGFLGHGHILDDTQTRTVFVSSRPLAGLNHPMGQTTVMPLILSGGTDFTLSGDYARAGLFQYVGSLEHPSAIAHVDATGVRTTLNLSNEEARQDASAWIPRARWESDPVVATGVRAAVLDWESLRWEQHSRRNAGQRGPVAPPSF